MKVAMLGMGFLAVLVLAMPLQAALTDGLVAYWPLDEDGVDGVGGVECTDMGNGQTAFSETAIAGKALRTDEANGSHSGLTKNPGVTFGLTDQFTLSCWYRINSVVGGGEKAAYHRGHGLGHYNPDDYKTFYFGCRFINTSDNPVFEQTTLETAWHVQGVGEWWHLVQTVADDGTMNVWYQAIGDDDHSGIDVAKSLSAYKSLDTSWMTANAITLGFFENKNTTGGRIYSDEVAVWNRVLTDPEIEELFDMGKVGTPLIPVPLTDGLVAYWPLDSDGVDVVGGVECTDTGTGSTSFETPAIVNRALRTDEAATDSGLRKSPGVTYGLSDKFSLSCWYRIDSVGADGEKTAYHRLHGIGYYNPDNFTAFTFDCRYVDGSGTPVALHESQINADHVQAAGEWWHLVQTVDPAGNHRVWYQPFGDADHDGADGSRSMSSYGGLDTNWMTNPLYSMTLGLYEGKGATGGRIRTDEVAIWNRVLTADDIETLFDRGKDGIPVIIPTPATLVLLALGGLALLLRRRP